MASYVGNGLRQMLKWSGWVNSSRYWLAAENAAFARTIPADALVLDAGAGDAPYRPLFAHARYESADFQKVPKPYASDITYVCDLSHIPVEDNRYDYIIFNQVMEHLPEPCLVARELNRVLRPGGKMLYTAPLFYEEHEAPYDFYRYTRHGVEHIFTKAGFSIDRISWLEGYFGTMGYQLRSMARFMPTRPVDYGGRWTGLIMSPAAIALKLLFRALSILFARLDVAHRYTASGYPKNYLAIITKTHRVDSAAGGTSLTSAAKV